MTGMMLSKRGKMSVGVSRVGGIAGAGFTLLIGADPIRCLRAVWRCDDVDRPSEASIRCEVM